MPLLPPPNKPTVDHAPDNNLYYARQLLANRGSRIPGRRPANGLRCSACNRKPPSNELCEIIIDPVSNLTAMIGIGRCHHAYLRSGLEHLLAIERVGRHRWKRQRVRRLRRLIRDLPRNL
jgi:hypothetical protein